MGPFVHHCLNDILNELDLRLNETSKENLIEEVEQRLTKNRY